MRLREKYADKAARDARFRDLKASGYNVRRGSIRNVQLHPMYVQDVPSGDTGFGNTDYMRFWSVLYTVEEGF
jgi:hypothetical protein